MTRPICDSSGETALNCISIVERGLRRLGIDPNAPAMRVAGRTMISTHVATMHERSKVAAISRRGSYDLSEHQVARIVVLKIEGKTQQEIADHIGCTQGTVAKRLLRLGIRTKPRRQAAAA